MKSWLCSMLDLWRGWLDSLDSPGGHIVLLIGLVAYAWHMFQVDNTAGGQVLNLALGALFGMLTTRKSNREQNAASTTTLETSTVPAPPHPPRATDPPPVASDAAPS